MMSENYKRWFDWAREIEAISQTGLHYAANEFDRQRYHRLMEISVEMFSAKVNLDAESLMDIFSKQLGYLTPKVDVRAAVFFDKKLLMVKERVDGGWTMPGGWADVGDIPSKAAEREAQEEAGYTVKAKKLIGVYDANRSEPLELFHAYKLVYLCDLIGGVPTTSYETDEVAFFELNDIPTNLSGERTRPRHIQDAFAVLLDPTMTTIFD